MILFRELSNEESELVKKWQPPRLSDSDGPSHLYSDDEQHASDGDDFVTTDIAHLRNDIRDSQLQQDANETHGNHASLTMVSPSPDMLQQTYDEGFAAGVQAEKSQAEAGAVNILSELLENLSAQHYQIDADIEREVLSLAKAMAKLLLRREAESDDAVMIAIVRNALAQMPSTSETPVVILNPDDLNLIQSVQTNPILATLIPDPDMARGDCRVKAGACTLDAGIDALVNSISSRVDQPAQAESNSEQTITESSAQVGE